MSTGNEMYDYQKTARHEKRAYVKYPASGSLFADCRFLVPLKPT